MSSFEIQEVAINLKLYKWFRLYNIFDPNSTKIYGFHIHRITGILFTIVVQCCILFGLLGCFVEMEDTINGFDLFVFIFFNLINFLSVLKICVFLYEANKTWDLLDSTRIDFLKSKQCEKHSKKLELVRDKSIKLTNFMFSFAAITLVIWMIYPLVRNSFLIKTGNPLNQRYQNIFNMRYPVTIRTYNQYYYVFYGIEVIIGIFVLYSSVLIDTFLISLCWVMVTQFEILKNAFEDIGNEYELLNEIEVYCLKSNEYFKSILIDQINLNLKLKLYYSIVWALVLIYVALSSWSIIMLTFSFILICITTESLPILNIIKIATPFTVVTFQVFLHCYFFGLINLKKESVNFGIYSCNWPWMDLKLKKLMLMAMKMNNSNKLMIKASPTKIVDVQLFFNVMKISYNIISIMVNTLGSNL